MAEITEIEWRDMPVVQAGEPLGAILRATLAHEYPSFIVRSELSYASWPESGHIALVGRVLHELSVLFPDKQLTMHTDPDFTGFREEPKSNLGIFHNDMRDTAGLSTWRQRSNIAAWHPGSGVAIHTHTQGSGGVIAASTGDDPRQIYKNHHDYSYESQRYRDPSHPHELLKRGLANTALTNSVMYEGYLNEGDSVVKIDWGPRSAWHRYDTDEAVKERHWSLTVIRDATKRRSIRRLQRGFDLPQSM